MTEISFSLRTLNSVPEEGSLTISFADDSLQLAHGGNTKSTECTMQDGSGLKLNCFSELHSPSGLISKITIEEPCGPGVACLVN